MYFQDEQPLKTVFPYFPVINEEYTPRYCRYIYTATLISYYTEILVLPQAPFTSLCRSVALQLRIIQYVRSWSRLLLSGSHCSHLIGYSDHNSNFYFESPIFSFTLIFSALPIPLSLLLRFSVLLPSCLHSLFHGFVCGLIIVDCDYE